MPKPRPTQQLRAKRTRRRLLAAARRVFADDGYASASVDDIARAAGCSKGAYYFHFATKEASLLALVDDWAQRQSDRLTKAIDGSRPDGTLADLLRALFSSDGADGRDQRLVLEFWLQGERNRKIARRLVHAHRSWQRLLAQAFRRAQEAGRLAAGVSPAASADMVLALHDGLAVQKSLSGAKDGSPRTRVSAALAFLGGLRPLRAAG